MFGQGSLAGAARVVLGLDNRDFNRDLIASERQFQRSTRSMERDAGQMARGVAVGTGAFQGFARAVAFASASFLGAAGFTALVRNSINAASDLVEAQTAVTAIFKDSAPVIRAWAEDAAQGLGQSERAALQNASSIGAMLIPMGYAASSAAEMAKRMVELARDLASLHNQDPSEMLNRIRAGLAGEAEPLRRFGVDLRVTAIEAFALREGLKKQGEELSFQGRLWVSYQKLLKDTQIAQGDFERTADNAANAQRTLRGQLENTQAALGRALLPTIERLLPKLTQWAEELEHNEDLQRDITDAIEGGADAAVSFANAIDDVSDALGGWENAFQLLLSGAIARSLTKVIGSPGSGTASAAGLLGMARLLRGISALGVIYVGVEIATNWDEIKKELQNELGNPDWWRQVFSSGVFGFLDPLIGPSGRGTGLPGDVVPDPRNPRAGGQARPSGTGANFIYPAGTSFSVGGGPGQGTHNARDWQSGNAVDIFASPGTPVLSPVDGTIVRVSGTDPSGGDRRVGGKVLFGYGVTIQGFAGMTYYLAHLDGVSVRAGDKVRRGQVIGQVATWKGGPAHVHVGVPWGNDPKAITLAGRGSLGDTPRATPDTEIEPPDDLIKPKRPKKKKRKSAADPDDPILEGLYVRLAVSEDTRRMTDDLKALDALIAYLNKKAAKEKDAGDRVRLIRERQGLEAQKTGILEDIQESRPLPKPVRIPGLDAVLGEFGRVQTGTAVQDLGGALGKVLVPNALAPTIKAWENMESKLRKKLRAAVGRRNALQRALNRLGRVRGPLRDRRMIQWHQQQIAAINEKIADLRDAIGASIAAQADLRAEATSRAQEEAEEAEQTEQRRAEAEEEEQADVAAENARLASEFRSEQQAAESAYQEGLVQTPAETRLAMARAAGTETSVDDLAALQTERTRLVGNLGRGSIETEIQIVNALNSIDSEIKRIQQNTGTLVDIEKNRESYLQALRSLRGDQSNIFNPLAELRGNTIRVENYFKSGPVDAHLWSKDLEFELKALVG
jgi:murein DD-endopeptidase MepM/ murein hydrolase activator NlpD